MGNILEIYKTTLKSKVGKLTPPDYKATVIKTVALVQRLIHRTTEQHNKMNSKQPLHSWSINFWKGFKIIQ